MGYFSEKTGQQLGDFIGNFLEYDTSNKSSMWRNFVRIRVALNVTKPLKCCKKIKKPDGSSFMACFKYEKLNLLCFIAA